MHQNDYFWIFVAGERPYHCGACGQRYTQGHLLKSHIRSRHQGNMELYNLDKKSDSTRGRKSLDIKHELPSLSALHATPPHLHHSDKIGSLLAAAAAASKSPNGKRVPPPSPFAPPMLPPSTPISTGLSTYMNALTSLYGMTSPHPPSHLSPMMPPSLMGGSNRFFNPLLPSMMLGDVTAPSPLSLTSPQKKDDVTMKRMTQARAAEANSLMSDVAAQPDLHMSPPSLKLASPLKRSHEMSTIEERFDGGANEMMATDLSMKLDRRSNASDDAVKGGQEEESGARSVAMQTEEEGKEDVDDVTDVRRGSSRASSLSPPALSPAATDASCCDVTQCEHALQLRKLRRSVARMLRCFAPMAGDARGEDAFDLDTPEVDNMLHDVMFSNMSDD